MKTDVKLICKKTNLKVISFSIVQTECIRKDMLLNWDGTCIEFDRECLADSIDLELNYTTDDGIEQQYRLTNEDLELDFFKECMRDHSCYRFNVTAKMIDQSKVAGPFIIDGVSRVVEIK